MLCGIYCVGASSAIKPVAVCATCTQTTACHANHSDTAGILRVQPNHQLAYTQICLGLERQAAQRNFAFVQTYM